MADMVPQTKVASFIFSSPTRNYFDFRSNGANSRSQPSLLEAGSQDLSAVALERQQVVRRRAGDGFATHHLHGLSAARTAVRMRERALLLLFGLLGHCS